MNQMKQSLCRRWATQACRVGLWLFMVGWLAQAGWATAARARPDAQPPQPVAAPALTPEAYLSQSVTQWVGRQQGIPPDQVQMQPLDPRVKVQACARPLNIDLPFSSAQTVRVRCPEPVWQLYVQVQTAAPDGRASAFVSGQQVGAGEQRRLVLVTAGALSRGMTVQAQDLRVQQVSVPAGGVYLDNPSDAVHAEVLRDLPAGTPLRRSDLRPSVLVKRGQVVQLSIGQSQGFMVSARVEALQDGRMGEHIKLKNPESGRTLSGVVRGPNLVEGL